MTDNEKMNAYIWASKVAPNAVPLLDLQKGDVFEWALRPGKPKVYRGRGWYYLQGSNSSVGRASTRTAVIKI